MLALPLEMLVYCEVVAGMVCEYLKVSIYETYQKAGKCT